MSLQWRYNRRSRWVWARQPALIGKRWLRHRNFVIKMLLFKGSSTRYFLKPKVFLITRYTVHLPPCAMPYFHSNFVWIGHVTLIWEFYWDDPVIQVKIDPAIHLPYWNIKIYLRKILVWIHLQCHNFHIPTLQLHITQHVLPGCQITLIQYIEVEITI